MTDVAFQWSSRYLERGFAQDEVSVRRWSVEEHLCFCEIDVERGPDGARPFHLSALTSHRIVAQLAIDSICLRAGLPKEALGEVYEVEHHVRYVREITHSHGINVRVAATKASRVGKLVATTFDYDVGDGSFVGTVCLGFAPVQAPLRGDLVQEEALEEYRAHYYSYYGETEPEARASRAVYSPKACVRFEPDASLASEIRALAADMSDCIHALHRQYLAGAQPNAAAVAYKVPLEHRPPSPTLIRLDVVEGPEGCRVVEINSGNCGGVETYARMHAFLRKRGIVPSDQPTLLLQSFIDALELRRRSHVEFLYVDDQSRFLSAIRANLFRASISGLTCSVTSVAEFMRRGKQCAPDALIYRDFLHEELASLGEVGIEAEQFFLGLPSDAYFPSFADEYLSDKHWIAEIDQAVRQGSHSVIKGSLADKWLKRMTPSIGICGARPERNLDFARPCGIVVKPADGFGGHEVTVLERGTLPIAASFYRGHDLWVAQPFLEAPLYSVERAGRGRQQVRLVHGVFLMGQRHASYAGTFSRLSPHRVVNIKNDGEVVFFVDGFDDWQH